MFLFLILAITLPIKIKNIGRPFWFNEVWRADLLSQENFFSGVFGTFDTPINFLMNVPAWFLATRVYNHEITFRMFPLVESLIVLLLFFLILKKITNNFFALWGTFVLSTLSWFLYFSMEFSPYMLDAGAFLFFIYLFLKNKNNSNLLFFAIFLLPELSMASFLYLPAIFSYLYISPLIDPLFTDADYVKKKSYYLKITFLLFATLLNSVIFYLFYLKPQIKSTLTNYWQDKFVGNYHGFQLIKYVFSEFKILFKDFLFPVNPYFSNIKFTYVLVFLFFIIGLIYLLKSKTVESRKLIIIFVLTNLTLFFFSFLEKWPFAAVRVNIFLFPLYLIFIISGEYYLFLIFEKKYQYIFLILVVVASLNLSSFLSYAKNGQMSEFGSGIRQTVAYIKNNMHDKDSIYVYHWMNGPGFDYYFNRYSPFSEKNSNLQIFEKKQAYSKEVKNSIDNDPVFNKGQIEKIFQSNQRVWTIYLVGMAPEEVSSAENSMAISGKMIEEKKYAENTLKLYEANTEN